MQEEGSSSEVAQLALLDYSVLLSPLKLLHGGILNHFRDCVCMHTARQSSYSPFSSAFANQTSDGDTHVHNTRSDRTAEQDQYRWPTGQVQNGELRVYQTLFGGTVEMILRPLG